MKKEYLVYYNDGSNWCYHIPHVIVKDVNSKEEAYQHVKKMYEGYNIELFGMEKIEEILIPEVGDNVYHPGLKFKNNPPFKEQENYEFIEMMVEEIDEYNIIATCIFKYGTISFAKVEV